MNLVGNGWHAAPVGLEALGSMQALLERCRDYYELLNARPANGTDALELFEGVPAGKTPADTIVLELRDDVGSAVGVVKLIRDFRRVREWYLSLLLLDPSQRGAGIGRGVVAALEGALASMGVDSLRLAVAEQNAGAFRFWTREGFRVDFVRPPRQTGQRWTVLMKLAKAIVPR